MSAANLANAANSWASQWAIKNDVQNGPNRKNTSVGKAPMRPSRPDIDIELPLTELGRCICSWVVVKRADGIRPATMRLKYPYAMCPDLRRHGDGVAS